jgi:hypothetical protein
MRGSGPVSRHLSVSLKRELLRVRRSVAEGGGTCTRMPLSASRREQAVGAIPIRPLQHLRSAIAAPSKSPRLTSRLTACGPVCMSDLPLESFGPASHLPFLLRASVRHTETSSARLGASVDVTDAREARACGTASAGLQKESNHRSLCGSSADLARPRRGLRVLLAAGARGSDECWGSPGGPIGRHADEPNDRSCDNSTDPVHGPGGHRRRCPGARGPRRAFGRPVPWPPSIPIAIFSSVCSPCRTA